ncbi:hypothetical protein PUNSTDRAFT_146212 [Punctularia strigosozonata HHB-11173 SS5]|uniref:PHD-type domain-containing protein n=1 Tax=Punctularia strigosozonata (strain HHB-11173) TaxID=741275 RepID=R7S515_PUNST|nr:uncharacterized protein PUNSTDRAFT_146212 [Punctularia strigosozonata HHB-11173 SS5]EIN04932.1 hypothetical protein PUNSTDRAFT_146212 [Punctularia strigosozonata HHB-11173 SS5]
MPRRTSARNATANSVASAPGPLSSALEDQSLDPIQANLKLLRRQWKWAAFHQFFYTFETLVALPDISIADIEDDLTRSTALVLPRIIIRLIHTISHDKKTNIDNWQTSLRRQYARRNPELNPLAPEPESVPLSSSPREEQDDPDGELEEPPSQQDSIATGVVERLSSAPVSTEPSTPKPEAQPSSAEQAQKDPRPTDWLQLPMLQKLDSLHLLTEWQFHNEKRLKQIMKDDGDDASWRIEPIGYDAKSNAYWLIGADRLWIQRSPPRPTNLKRKRAAARQPSRKAARTDSTVARSSPAMNERRKVVSLKAASPAPAKNTRRDAGVSPATANTGRGARAAKLQANIKLDEQAKALEAFRREAENGLPGRARATRQPTVLQTPSKPPLSGTPRGTRASARLRGTVVSDEDEWQPIPQEWLKDGNTDEVEGGMSEMEGGTRAGSGDEDILSELSDLTELTEEKEELEGEKTLSKNSRPQTGKPPRSKTIGEDVVIAHQENELATSRETDDPSYVENDPMPPSLPADFVEWEMICGTLEEWEHIADRFANATHYLEKALYKTLSQQVVPIIVEELREIERKRRLEEAVVHRKRSSRIAEKESVREAEALAAKQKAEEEAALTRAQRLEARRKKEEEDRERREKTREQRRLERELRENGQNKQSDAGAIIDVDTMDSDLKGKPRHKSAASTPASGTQTPRGEWELYCEICYRQGRNVDDGVPVVACSSCSRWQHIPCHDRADRIAGKQKRNWEKDTFICQRCSFDVANTHRPKAPISTSHITRPGTNLPRSASSNGVYLHHNPVMQGSTAPRSSSAQAALVPPLPSASMQMMTGYMHPPVPAGSSMPQPPLSFAHYQPPQKDFVTGTQPYPQPQIHRPAWTPGNGQYAVYHNGAGHPSQNHSQPIPGPSNRPQQLPYHTPGLSHTTPSVLPHRGPSGVPWAAHSVQNGASAWGATSGMALAVNDGTFHNGGHPSRNGSATQYNHLSASSVGAATGQYGGPGHGVVTPTPTKGLSTNPQPNGLAQVGATKLPPPTTSQIDSVQSERYFGPIPYQHHGNSARS